ncbi:MAG: c-type cytochrome [Chloroflexi bacterium]|nr:c-type cytochrome [Chloroflexota bacterium]
MKRVLKWSGIVLGGLLGVVILAALGLLLLGGSRVNRSYNMPVEKLAIPTDAASVQRGQHLAEAVVGCAGCHGSNLAGDKVFEEGPIGRVYAPNITGGQGGVTGAYTDQDWVRAIRHGVSPSGDGLLIMPAEVYQNLSAEDLGAVIAYLKTVPPVDNQVPKPDIRPLGRILVALGAFGEVVPAQLVDHTAPLPGSVATGITTEYGRYLVSIAGCQACHGKELSGGQPPEPGSPFAPNLTPGGRLGGLSEQAFATLFRARGAVESEFMPWEEFAKMTDEEIGAIWRYLTSLPAKE